MRYLISLLAVGITGTLLAGEPFALKRCELVPLSKNQVSFQIDGVETTRWHFGREYPRPFFYPFNGPSGHTLTRMGHPGAANHDHHRSVWIAHKNINGLDFWSEGRATHIRQTMWYGYRDGENEAIMAARVGWFSDQGRELMQQDIVAALMPLDGRERALEIQLTMRPAGKQQSVELGKTNFGFLSVRVAKTIAAYFGGGKLTNSERQQGEPQIFGKPARWMDYSGPIAVGKGPDRSTVIEGITYYDHPKNPRYPTHWHVREDGWMGASFCLRKSYTLTHDRPLTLRYLLHAHSGGYDHDNAHGVHKAFVARPGFEVLKSTKQHLQFEVKRNRIE